MAVVKVGTQVSKSPPCPTELTSHRSRTHSSPRKGTSGLSVSLTCFAPGYVSLTPSSKCPRNPVGDLLSGGLCLLAGGTRRLPWATSQA